MSARNPRPVPVTSSCYNTRSRKTAAPFSHPMSVGHTAAAAYSMKGGEAMARTGTVWAGPASYVASQMLKQEDMSLTNDEFTARQYLYLLSLGFDAWMAMVILSYAYKNGLSLGSYTIEQLRGVYNKATRGNSQA